MSERGLQLLQGTVERLLRRNATMNLIKILNKTHHADIAHLFKHLPDKHALIVFELLPDVETAGDVISELEVSYRNHFLQLVNEDRLVEIFGSMASDDAAEVLAEMPEEVRESLLRKMAESGTDDLEEILSYPDDTAGRIMVTEYLALPETMSAREAIAEIRAAAEAEMVFYLYVIDEHGKLVGVISLRQLVMASDDTPLSDIMTRDVVAVKVDTDQEEVARRVARYNILAIPVIDHDDVLVGIVTVDDIIDVIRQETTEDMLKMAGTSEEEITSFSVMRSVKVRLPWLIASWFGGLLVSMTIDHFESKIIALTALAAFIPIILGMGGNIGTQSATITVRGLATGRIDPSSLGRIIFKEIRVGLLLGLAYGVLLGLAGWYLKGNFDLGIVVGIAICANMTFAAMLGTFLPLLLNKLHIDPAVASGPFVTTMIDNIGVLVYFAIATIFLPV